MRFIMLVCGLCLLFTTGEALADDRRAAVCLNPAPIAAPDDGDWAEQAMARMADWWWRCDGQGFQQLLTDTGEAAPPLGSEANDNVRKAQWQFHYLRAAQRRIDEAFGDRCEEDNNDRTCDLFWALQARADAVSSVFTGNIGSAQFTVTPPETFDHDFKIGVLGLGTNGNGAAIVSNVLEEFRFRPYLSGCEQGSSRDSCQSEPGARERAGLAVQLLPAAYLLSLAAQEITGPIMTEFREDFSGLNARWDAYHFGGGHRRTQLPWELAINGYCFERQSRGEGFHEPPDGAIIFMRPAIGAEWGGDGNTARLAFVGEIIGYSHWGYRADNTRGPEWGGALIASYNADARNRWGYGAHVRTPLEGVTVGAVHRRDDGWSVIVSSNIVGLLNGGGALTGGLCDRFSIGPICELRGAN